MIKDFPLFGVGLGGWPELFLHYHGAPWSLQFYREAHNDYLQLLCEMGVLGFGTMIWFLILVYRTAFRKIKNWTSDVSGAVTLACILGFTGILVHSLFDFNLEIPANAALFYVLCTLAAAPPMLQRARKRKPQPTEEDEMLPASEVV